MQADGPAMSAEEKRAQREAKKKQKQMQKQKKTGKGEGASESSTNGNATTTTNGEAAVLASAPPAASTPAASNQSSSTTTPEKDATASDAKAEFCTPAKLPLQTPSTAPSAPVPSLTKERAFQLRSNADGISRLAKSSTLNPNAVAFVPGATSPPRTKESGGGAAPESATTTTAKTTTPLAETNGSAAASTTDSKPTAPAPMSKAELRKKRREEQEAQRAAKAAAKAEKAPSAAVVAAVVAAAAKTEPKKPFVEQKEKTVAKASESIAVEVKKVKKATGSKKGIFDHLPSYDGGAASLTLDLPFNAASTVHPLFVKVGLQIREGKIQGSNARCVGLMMATRQLILDYTTRPNTEMSRDLDSEFKPNVDFIDRCRPLAVSQSSFVRFIRNFVTQLDGALSEKDAKDHLLQKVDEYLQKITLASEAISGFAKEKIKDGDVIMTYACSSLISRVLLDAKARGTSFHVIVVDGRPKSEGRELLRRLSAAGIPLTYIDINHAAYVVDAVSKVFLGAAALLANGGVMSRVGAAQVALVAKSANKPVIVCCETYKFCERVQTDAIVSNELGDPSRLLFPGSPLTERWKKPGAKLALLNIAYDVTPASLVALVITELGPIPCTSVPVVLRVKSGS